MNEVIKPGTRITESQIKRLAELYNIPYPHLRAIIEVEGAGRGFSEVTGRMLIQFEPSYFKKTYAQWQDNKRAVWVNNGIGNQPAEYEAFNSAFAIAPAAAMQSCSIGIMQVMGFHFATLGFTTPGAMWDHARQSEANQVDQGLRFIKSLPVLYKAVRVGDCFNIAYYYNGSGFKELAKREKSIPYDERIWRAIKKFSIAH